MLGQQLLGADDAEFVALFGTDEILAALAAGKRKIRRSNVAPARQVRKQGIVFVVGMRRDHHDASHVVQALQHQAHLGLAGERLLRIGRGGGQRHYQAQSHRGRRQDGVPRREFHAQP
jgi:hypothetical protein